jgi:hypothetical protein
LLFALLRAILEARGKPRKAVGYCRSFGFTIISTQTPLPIISIKEARKLLGAPAAAIDDTQMGNFIDTLHLLARQQLKNSGSKNYTRGVKSKT